MIILLGETLSGEIFVVRNFRHFSKNSSLSPDKVSPDTVIYSEHLSQGFAPVPASQ